MLSKKVLGSLLAAALLTTVVAPVNAATGFKDVDGASNASLSTAVNRLNVLGIMNGVAADNFDKDADFTRAQAAKVFVVATGYGKLATGTTTKFTDVKENWKGETGYVNTANLVGLVSGWTKNGKLVFAPDEKVTYGQLATMAVRALGYKEADLQGDTWPYNYIAKASELGLFDDVDSVDVTATAKRSDVALIANRMLEQHKKDAVANASGIYKTLLDTISSKLGVTTVTGVTVTATPAVDSTLTANQVKLDTTVYDASGVDASQLALGSKVDVFVKSGKVVLVSNAVATSVTQTVTRTVAGTVYYKDAAGTEQSLALDASAKLFKNGSAVTELSTLVGTTATLVDNNADGKYDYVVASYTNAPVVVSANVTSDDVATVSAIAYAGGSVSLKKADGTAAKVTVTGAATKLSEIKANDVIHVTKTDDNSVVNLFVVRNNVTGKATLKTTDNKVTVNGAVYSFNANIASSIVLNTTNTFLLDKDNNIVAVTAAPAATVASATYGVVLASVQATATLDMPNVTNVYKTRILKLDGTTVDLTTAVPVTPSAVLSFYTLDSNGVATVAPAAYGTFNTYNVVPDTLVYAISADGKTVTAVKYADLNVTGASAYKVVKTDNTMGDYAVIAFVNPTLTSADTTGYGYAVGKTGETVISDTVTADVYSVFVNGVQQSINVAHGSTVPTYFTKLSKASTGLTTATAAASANVVTGKVNAIDSTRILVGSTVLTLDANVKVYNTANSTVKVDTLSNVTTDMTNNATIVTDATTGNVVEIVINK